MFGIFVHYSTRPIYDVSKKLFCWPPSVDIFKILPRFLWQPLLRHWKEVDNTNLVVFMYIKRDNRMAGRRGRQNAYAWQKWQAMTITYVFCRDIHLTLKFTSLYRKIPFKAEWSLAKSWFKQNYCHACYTRFAVFFPLPSGCVIMFSKSERTQQYGRGKKKANLV